MFVLNLVTRSLIVIIGIGIAFGVEPFTAIASPLREIFGIVVSLFGVYRLVILFTGRNHTHDGGST